MFKYIQQALDADQKTIQEINFTGNLQSFRKYLRLTVAFV